MLETTQLLKGEYLSPEQCESQFGIKRDRPEYGIKLLALCKRLEANNWQSGYHCTMVCDGGGVRCLTDAEASKYNDAAFKNHMAGMLRRHEHAMHVDTSALDEEQARAHDRRLTVNGAVLAAATNAYKHALRALPCERTTPKLGVVKKAD